MKVTTMRDAIATYVLDGETVAIEGFTACICFAAAHEIIRQGWRDLTLCRMTPDLAYDLMVAAGCARKLVFSYLGNPLRDGGALPGGGLPSTLFPSALLRGERLAEGQPSHPLCRKPIQRKILFDKESGEMLLESLHPGAELARVQAEVGWELKIAPNLRETKPPTAEELRLLRKELDPQGIYRR